MAKENSLTLREQVRAVIGVAALSIRIAPGAVVFKMVGAVIDAVLPIATTYFAAKTTTALVAAYGGNHTAHHQAIVYIVTTASLGLLMTIWSSLDNYVQAKMRYVVETRISSRMYEHFLSLDFWRYDDKDTIDLYDRASKFSSFYAYVFDRISNILSSSIGALTAVVALLTVGWGIALFIFLALIPGVFVQFKLSREQIQNWNLNVGNRRVLSMLDWLISQPRSISELRLYGMSNHLLRRRSKLRDEDELKRIEIESRSIPWMLAANVLEAISELTALIWIALQVIARKQPLGQFIYVQQMVSRAIGSMGGLVSTLSSVDEDVANLFDYEQFMQLPAGHTGGRILKNNPQTICFRDVSFRYPGRKVPDVLRHVSFEIARGQHVAIVGENGAGKTTLVKLLTGLYHASEGTVMLDDIDICDVDVASWHRYLGVLQQEYGVYGFATVRDNVILGDIESPYDEKRLERALRDAEASAFTAKLPSGLDSYVNNWMEDDDGNKGTDLSGGQWQRLALARDFYRAAPVIILDEPTSAIDALAEARIFKRLFSTRDRTVITISHRLSTIKKADIIYMLQDGQIVERGTHDELIAKKGAFYHMFESQIEG